MMPSDTELQRAIALANVLRTAAQAVADRAFELWIADELSNEDYDQVSLDYLEVIRRIQQITITASRAAAGDLAPLLDQLEGAKGELEQHLDKVHGVRNVLTIITKMAAVAGTIMAAVAAPVLIPVAVGAIADLVQTWVWIADE
jgi:hypothetical protein